MYGLFYSVLSLFTVLAAYNDLGFGYSVAYFVPKYIKEGRYKEAWSLYKYDQIIEVGTSLLLSGILILSADFLVDNYFKVPEAKSLIYIFCAYFVANSFLEALHKFFSGLQQEAYYSSIQPVRLFFTALLSGIFFLFGSGNIVDYALGWMLAYFATSIIFQLLLYTKNKNITGSKLDWDKDLFVKMAKYALPTIVTTTVFTLTTSIDVFFLTLFRGVAEVGIYNVALPIAAISNIFISPLNALIMPMVSEHMEGEKDKARFLLGVVLKIVPFIALYFALFVVLFPTQTIGFLFGEKWVGLVELPLMILITSFIFSSLSGFLVSFISGMGKVKERFFVTVIIAVTNLVISIPMIYFYGVLGAVLANAFVFVFSAISYGVVVRSELSFKLPTIFYLKLIVFSAAIVIVTKLSGFAPVNLFQYLLSGFVYSLVFLIFAFTMKIITKDMLESLKFNFK